MKTAMSTINHYEKKSILADENYHIKFLCELENSISKIKSQPNIVQKKLSQVIFQVETSLKPSHFSPYESFDTPKKKLLLKTNHASSFQKSPKVAQTARYQSESDTLKVLQPSATSRISKNVVSSSACSTNFKQTEISKENDQNYKQNKLKTLKNILVEQKSARNNENLKILTISPKSNKILTCQKSNACFSPVSGKQQSTLKKIAKNDNKPLSKINLHNKVNQDNTEIQLKETLKIYCSKEEPSIENHIFETFKTDEKKNFSSRKDTKIIIDTADGQETPTLFLHNFENLERNPQYDGKEQQTKELHNKTQNFDNLINENQKLLKQLFDSKQVNQNTEQNEYSFGSNNDEESKIGIEHQIIKDKSFDESVIYCCEYPNPGFSMQSIEPNLLHDMPNNSKIEIESIFNTLMEDNFQKELQIENEKNVNLTMADLKDFDTQKLDYPQSKLNNFIDIQFNQEPDLKDFDLPSPSFGRQTRMIKDENLSQNKIFQPKDKHEAISKSLSDLKRHQKDQRDQKNQRDQRSPKNSNTSIINQNKKTSINDNLQPAATLLGKIKQNLSNKNLKPFLRKK